MYQWSDITNTGITGDANDVLHLKIDRRQKWNEWCLGHDLFIYLFIYYFYYIFRIPIFYVVWGEELCLLTTHDGRRHHSANLRSPAWQSSTLPLCYGRLRFSTCKAILGRGQPGLMKWFLLWIMALVQDRSVDMLTSSPARYHCTTDTPGRHPPPPPFPSRHAAEFSWLSLLSNPDL